MTFTWNTDDVYTYTGDTLDYYVTSGEIMVYEGRAVKSPSKSGIEINLRKIAEDWLEMEFRDFLELNGALYHHEDAFRTFKLYRSSDDAVLYEFNCVINDLGVRYPTSGVYNDPVDGCADCRQKLFVTYFGNWTGSTEEDVVVPGPEPWVFTAYPTDAPYSCGLYYLWVRTNKNEFTITVDTPAGVSFIEVLPYQNGYALFSFSVEANTSSSPRFFTLVFHCGTDFKNVTFLQEGFVGTGSDLFAYKSGTNVQVDPNTGAVNPWRDSDDSAVTVTSDTLVSSGDWSTYRKKEFSNDLQTIGEYAFSGNTGMTDLRWEASYGETIHIDNFAFRDNQLLKSVVLIGNCGYESVDRYAFSGCTGLEVFESYGMSLSPDYWYRRKGVFSGCTSLKTVRLSLHFQVFEFPFVGCDNLREISVGSDPSHVLVRGDMFVDLPALRTIRIRGLKRLDYGGEVKLVRNCPSLTDLWWDGLTGTASVAFPQIISGCPSFTAHCVDGDVVIPAT